MPKKQELTLEKIAFAGFLVAGVGAGIGATIYYFGLEKDQTPRTKGLLMNMVAGAFTDVLIASIPFIVLTGVVVTAYATFFYFFINK